TFLEGLQRAYQVAGGKPKSVEQNKAGDGSTMDTKTFIAEATGA
ncbi:unnamed protein product, partial [marine sediment metagenome]